MKPVYREIKQACFCRCCGEVFRKEESYAPELVFFKSESSTQGQIILCTPCIVEMMRVIVEARVAEPHFDGDLDDLTPVYSWEKGRTQYEGNVYDEERYDREA